jgi:hypothetical protein
VADRSIETPQNRAPRIYPDSGADLEISARAGVLGRRIQGRRHAAARVECECSVLRAEGPGLNYR